MWNRWLPVDLMQLSLIDASARTASTASPWGVAYGPAAALVCSTNRLGWTVTSATGMLTDDGREIDLSADPPIIVKRLVEKTVRNWRWRNMVAAHPQLPREGANFNPILKLIVSKRNDANWNPKMVGP